MGELGPKGLPREPQQPNIALFPVGSDTIQSFLATYNPETLPQVTEKTMKLVDKKNSLFSRYLTYCFTAYQESMGMREREANLARNAYNDGSMFVYRLVSTQAPDSMPVFKGQEHINHFKAERTAMRKFALENGIEDTDTEAIAQAKVSQLTQEHGELALEVLLLDVAGKLKDHKPFLVGAMAAYSGLRAAWTYREEARIALKKKEDEARIADKKDETEKRATEEAIKDRGATTEGAKEVAEMVTIFAGVEAALDQPEPLPDGFVGHQIRDEDELFDLFEAQMRRSQ